MAGLTARQQRFSQEYMVDLNATQAAIRAGYSVKTAEVQGPRLLRNVRVKEHIDELKAQAGKNLDLKINDVLSMLLDSHKEAKDAKQYGPAVRAVELLGNA